MSENILEINNLSKYFGGLAAVSDCSLKVKRGTITGIIGPNGSGKTTLFNLIDQGFGAGILGAMFLLFTAGNAYLSLQRGSDRLWEDELPSKKVNAAWRDKLRGFSEIELKLS